MKILIFNPYHQDVNHRIINAVMAFQPCRVIEVDDHPSFRTAFSNCLSGETIVVFFVENERDMLFLEAMNSKFFDIKLIVNHPDQNDQFHERILKLYPRIMTVTHECLHLIPQAVCGIIKKLTNDSVTKIIIRKG